MNDDDVIDDYTTNIKKNHSVQLMPAIEHMMNEHNMTPQQLDAIVVAQGPGSYTGLRIGVTTAKTLAYTLHIPLYGVSSLKALAHTLTHETRVIVPVFNARREHVYAGAYQFKDGHFETIIEDQYIAIKDLNDKLQSLNDDYIFVGHDTTDLEDLLDGPTLHQLPRAIAMKPLIHTPEDTHTFKPTYLKLSEAEQNWINQNQKT
nr:tRNA (adenosine(37)-N6)-threonylcarbamoyltransferase complex dimerization subunit type 1 TsaB [Staphylococcus massiliensis]